MYSPYTTVAISHLLPLFISFFFSSTALESVGLLPLSISLINCNNLVNNFIGWRATSCWVCGKLLAKFISSFLGRWMKWMKLGKKIQRLYIINWTNAYCICLKGCRALCQEIIPPLKNLPRPGHGMSLKYVITGFTHGEERHVQAFQPISLRTLCAVHDWFHMGWEQCFKHRLSCLLCRRVLETGKRKQLSHGVNSSLSGPSEVGKIIGGLLRVVWRDESWI